MMSLGVNKDGIILPSEEERKRIITQMKVRTTLKGDKSWIQQKSGSEEDRNHSPIHSPSRIRGNTGRSPASPRTLSPNCRGTFLEPSSQVEAQSPSGPKSPSKKSPTVTSPSGYLIRGVFTKTIDNTSPSSTASNGLAKSAKNASQPRFTQGYKMTTEDYKKLAPYNIKQEVSGPGDLEPSVSPDEQKKRTEAASSVLRRTASRERSYVLSAAKKSNRSPVQEAPPFIAKRVDIEDDLTPRSRSQTVPASAWSSSHRKSSTNGEGRGSSGIPWNESRVADPASSARNIPDLEKHKMTSWDHSALKFPASPSNRSEQDEINPQATLNTETRSTFFSEDSWETRRPNNGTAARVPHIVLSPEASQKRSHSHYRPGNADASPETNHLLKAEGHLHDAEVGFPRFSPDHKEGTSPGEGKYRSQGSRAAEFYEHRPVTEKVQSFPRDNTDALSRTRYRASAYMDKDADPESKRFSSGFEKITQDMGYESPSDMGYRKVEAYLAKSGSWSSESSLSTTGLQMQLPRAAERDEAECKASRSSSLPTETGASAPDGPQRDPGSDSDAGSLPRGRPVLGMSEASYRMPSYLNKPLYNQSGHRTWQYLDPYAKDAIHSLEMGHGRPSYLSNQPYDSRRLAMRHDRTSYVNQQECYHGRLYFPFQDSPNIGSPRSHRMPFYKDICDSEIRRNSMGSDELKTPSASGYDSDPTSSSKGLLFVKESINSSELSSSPRYNSRSLADLSELEKSSYSTASYLNSAPLKRSSEDICTYCGREIRNCAKISIENLKICCHEYCFRCGICHKPMGDLLDKIFIHRDIVHCDNCYQKLF